MTYVQFEYVCVHNIASSINCNVYKSGKKCNNTLAIPPNNKTVLWLLDRLMFWELKGYTFIIIIINNLYIHNLGHIIIIYVIIKSIISYSIL